MERLAMVGEPSTFTCPDCGGTLFELHDKKPGRYICHTGHAYSLRGLTRMQEEARWPGKRPASAASARTPEARRAPA